MVRQYPYILFAETISESYQNEDGDWVVGESERIEIGKCRDEVGGSGALVSSEDGQKHEYSWMIYAPKSTPKLKQGTLIEVENEHGDIRAYGRIIRYSKDQLNVRIWI